MAARGVLEEPAIRFRKLALFFGAVRHADQLAGGIVYPFGHAMRGN